MRIGEKIKMLRTRKLMTQSELAGTEITRNMLSRIENGVAQPSLDTLRYIAGRLNVSPGFLLAEGEDEQLYFKRNDISGIKTTYLSGDNRICRDMCLNSLSAKDDEIQLILAECTLGIAVEEFCAGRLRSACEYFDMALEACTETIYDTDRISSVAAVYFRYMRGLSATLSSDIIDENEAHVYSALNDAFCVYALAFLGDRSVSVMPAAGSPYAMHVDALGRMNEKNYAQAYEYLHAALMSEEPLPEPVLYFIFRDLEICCKELEDFKGAYEYSLNKIELLQKLLS